MAKTIVEQLAAFGRESEFARLPAPVVAECKRIVLDSFGCALAAVDEPKGRIGIEYGWMTGGTGNATIIGTQHRVSIFGAAFANGELINALDFDAVLPPGHVTPYVLPGALAVGESLGVSGKALINVVAVAHEMSYRIGKAMDYLRDTKDGKVSPPPVFGYSSTIFGATAAIVMLKSLPDMVLAHALGIAGSIAPVQSQIAWFQHAPSSTIKYLHAGALTQAAMTAAHMAELGHRGDAMLLDDREFGFARFIGTRRWEPERITDRLGSEWRFPAEQSFKPYPHCRILHALLGCMTDVLDQHDIQPTEIDGIKAWVEGFTEQPVWLNRTIERPFDAQFSIAHGLALGAHRVQPGKAWQDPALVYSPSVLSLMDKVVHEVHPNYVELLTAHGASRPARIEIRARGQTFVGEQRYPKGSPSPEPWSTMTDAELAAKFRINAEGVLAAADVDRIVDEVQNLERVSDFGTVMRKLAPRDQAQRAREAAD
ncbi:MAG: MmgE/PrpD family protein [Burkholderiales bacterium]|nr:MmgE/PrpD family protein [Burkholderiales bacterium]